MNMREKQKHGGSKVARFLMLIQFLTGALVFLFAVVPTFGAAYEVAISNYTQPHYIVLRTTDPSNSLRVVGCNAATHCYVDITHDYKTGVYQFWVELGKSLPANALGTCDGVKCVNQDTGKVTSLVVPLPSVVSTVPPITVKTAEQLRIGKPNLPYSEVAVHVEIPKVAYVQHPLEDTRCVSELSLHGNKLVGVGELRSTMRVEGMDVKVDTADSEVWYCEDLNTVFVENEYSKQYNGRHKGRK